MKSAEKSSDQSSSLLLHLPDEQLSTRQAHTGDETPDEGSESSLILTEEEKEERKPLLGSSTQLKQEEMEFQNQLLTLLEHWRGHKERYVFQKQLVNVLVIYTGGTIGMEPSEHGLKARRDFLGDVFRKHILLYDREYVERHYGPDSDEIVTPLTNFKHRIRVRLHSLDRIEDSSNVDAETWTQICKVIDHEYANFDSFLILHGTDTLAYSASALSFALQGLSRTVILTGAMLPLRDMRSDGYRNLIGSLLIAGHYFIPEVMIYFNNKLLRGNRTTKISASEQQAFDSPNFRPLGQFSNHFKINWKYILKPPKESQFSVFTSLRAKISSIKVTPLLHEKVFQAAFDPSFDAVVIQGYAMGNFPARRTELFSAVKVAIERGVIVVVASQVARGTVIDSYEVLQQLTRLGAVISLDMTFECVLCKLSYLLGKYRGRSKKIKELFLKNLRGELTDNYDVKERNSFSNGKFVRAVASVISSSLPDDYAGLSNSLNPYITNAVAAMGNTIAMSALKMESFSLAESDFSGRTALHVAAKWGKKENIKFIIKESTDLDPADINKVASDTNSSPLAVAIQNRNYDSARALHKRGAEFIMPPHEYADLLCEIGAEGDLQRLEILNQVRADLNVQNFDGRTVGHLAAACGHCNILIYLKEKCSFDFNLKDRHRKRTAEYLSPELIAQLKGY